ncbi:MAG: M56 family metallopeptidase [Planctomycetota bacterium]|jgi:beta-lactamase regulating signal transducer with metallopeptidase domain
MNAASTSVAGLLVGWLADYYFAATLMLLVTLVAWRWARQPAHRIAVAWFMILELIVLAVVCALPSWPRTLLIATPFQPAAAESPRLGEPDLVAEPAIPSASVVREDPVSSASLEPEVSESVAEPIPPESHLDWIGMIAVAYLAGAALVALWLCWGVGAATWLRKRARPAADPLQSELSQAVGGNGRPPRLLVSSHVASAVALGVLRPTIVLPAALAESGPAHTLRAVLLHEWAHVRNRDLWVLALGRCLLAVLFAHPLFWWLRRAIRSDQELLADAVAAGEDRPAYAQELLRLIRTTARPSPMAPSAAVGIWESSSQLSRRIAMLLNEEFRVEHTASRSWQRRALAPLVLLGVACSLVTLQSARATGEPAEPAAAKASSAVGAERVDGAKPLDNRQRLRVLGASGTMLNSVQLGAPRDVIFFPGYHLLKHEEVLREMKITAEQRKKLKQIAAQHHTDLSETRRKNREAARVMLPQDRTALLVNQKKKDRKRMEAVVTSQQMQALDDLTLYELASMRLTNPETCKKLGISAEQQRQMQQMHDAAKSRFRNTARETGNKMAEVLTSPQKTRLLELTLGPERLGGVLTLTVVTDGESRFRIPSPHPYPDLSEPRVQKRLGFSETQQNQVREILDGSRNLTEKLVEELESLPPAKREIKTGGSGGGGYHNPNATKEDIERFHARVDRKRREFLAEFEKHPLVKTSIELRKRFEAVLTPEQLAKYKDMTLRNLAHGTLADRRVLDRVGVSDEQRATLFRIYDESYENQRHRLRERGRELLTVLTPAQQDTLREESARQIY